MIFYKIYDKIEKKLKMFSKFIRGELKLQYEIRGMEN